MAEENRSWGYDRIVGALANLGHKVSDQTVGNVLRRHGLPPAPERKHTTTWAAFIRAHLAVLAGTDFFTVEVLTLRGRSVGSRKRVVRSLCNVARGWVVSCVITIKRLRELAGRSRPMAVRFGPGRAYAKADALLTTMIAGELTSQLP